MPKIFFKNNVNWKGVSYHLETKNQIVDLPFDGSFVEVDEDELDENSFIYFFKGNKKTDKYLIAKKDIGIKYAYNPKIKKNDTYLYNPYLEDIGHVDTFELTDEVNLAYRGGKKIINVHVPHNYDPNKKYGLLYFYDSQNLFRNSPKYTAKNDPYGGWQLDEVLSIYDKDIIIVGIENADDHRMLELTLPVTRKELMNEKEEEFAKYLTMSCLDKLLNFIHETVHPFIKNKYSIDEQNIGVGGASCGGIAAYLTALSYPDIYNYALVYSPAFLFYAKEYFIEFIKNIKSKKLPKLHIYSGFNDDLEKTIYNSTIPMKELMVNLGYPANKIKETYVKEFMHNEIAWRLILPTSFDFLLD